MNRRYIWLFTLVFLLAGAFRAAAETVSLSMEEAVERALDQSINLKKSAIDLAQTEYAANHLWSEIFPGFNLSAGLTFLPSTPLFTKPGFAYNSDALSYSLNFGLSFSLNASLRSSMKRIELAYRSQLLSYENALKQLEIQVVKNYLSLITRKENIVYMEESLRLAEQNAEKDRIARENGFLSELAWLNSQLSAETARYNLSYANVNYQNALGEFLTLLDMDTNTDVVFTGTMEIAQVLSDPEQLILEYLPKRPDIISRRQAIERLELTRNVTALSGRSPSLDLSASWRGGTPSNNSKGLGAPFSDSVSGSLTLRIPVDSWIPGTKQNQAVRNADAEIEKARLDLLDAETAAKNQIRALVSGLRNTWGNLEIARMRVSVAGRTVEAAEVGFRNGTVEFRDLEGYRKDLSDARQRLLEGEYSYQSMLLDLAVALNLDRKTLTRQLAEETSRSMP